MKRFLLAAAALALIAPEAQAAKGSGVESAFGNTIVSTYPDGRTGLLWLNANGTYTAKGRRRTSSSGTWTVRGQKVCLKQKKPKAAPFAFCTPFKEGGVGASWTAKAVTGERITIKLVGGRVS